MCWYLEKVTCPVFVCTVAYTEQVTFYKVPETQSHIYLVGLYETLTLEVDVEQVGKMRIAKWKRK